MKKIILSTALTLGFAFSAIAQIPTESDLPEIGVVEHTEDFEYTCKMEDGSELERVWLDTDFNLEPDQVAQRKNYRVAVRHEDTSWIVLLPIVGVSRARCPRFCLNVAFGNSISEYENDSKLDMQMEFKTRLTEGGMNSSTLDLKITELEGGHVLSVAKGECVLNEVP